MKQIAVGTNVLKAASEAVDQKLLKSSRRDELASALMVIECVSGDVGMLLKFGKTRDGRALLQPEVNSIVKSAEDSCRDLLDSTKTVRVLLPKNVS